jgi:cytochrome c-type biogenesis protein
MSDSLPAARPPSVQQGEIRPAAGLSLRLTTLLHAALFVLGFSIVFIVGWGGAATLLGSLFGSFKSQLAWIGGIVVIVFGLSTLGVLRIPWLSYDTRPQWSGKGGGGLLSSGLMGMFFAAGWSPCVGATLGSILSLGLSQQTTGQAMVLSSGYALGLGLPFLAMGLMMDRATGMVRRLGRHIRTVEVVSGVFLIIIGLMMVTNSLSYFAIWSQRTGLYLDLTAGTGAGTPSYLIALAAGLLSFLSPCVLPLVPAYLGYLSGHVVRQAKGAGNL